MVHTFNITENTAARESHMHKLTKLLLFPILLCLLSSGSFAQKAARRTRASSPPVICKLSSVPKGMVVVGYNTNSTCSDGKQLLVKRPANGDIICAESPLPAGFSITTEAQGDAAGTCPKKAFLITGHASTPATARRPAESSDDTIARAFANRTSNLQVKGEGRVIRLLSDDVSGSRHQRFIVQLASGQTLLISHNIDIAPRINNLKTGDRVGFYGEYEWNAKGGVIHWTHHDPRGRHVTGWIFHKGRTYQ